MSRDSDGIMSLTFGDLGRLNQGQLLKNSCRDWILRVKSFITCIFIEISTTTLLKFPWVWFGNRTTWVFYDVFTRKLLEIRLPFFYTSKYEIFAVTKKNQIFIFNVFSWYLTPNMALQTIILINLGNSEITVSSSGTDGSGSGKIFHS